MKKKMIAAGLALCCMVPTTASAWSERPDTELKRESLTKCLLNSGMAYVEVKEELAGEYPVVIERASQYAKCQRNYDTTLRRITDVCGWNSGAYTSGTIYYDEVTKGPIRRKIDAVEACLKKAGYVIN